MSAFDTAAADSFAVEAALKGYQKGGLPGAVVGVATSKLKGQAIGVSKDLVRAGLNDHAPKVESLVKVAKAILMKRTLASNAKGKASVNNVKSIRAGQFGNFKPVSRKGMPVTVQA